MTGGTGRSGPDRWRSARFFWWHEEGMAGSIQTQVARLDERLNSIDRSMTAVLDEMRRRASRKKVYRSRRPPAARSSIHHRLDAVERASTRSGRRRKNTNWCATMSSSPAGSARRSGRSARRCFPRPRALPRPAAR